MAGSPGAVRAVGDRLQAASSLVSGWNVDGAAVSDSGGRGRCGPNRLGRFRGLDSRASPPARRRRGEDAGGHRSSKGEPWRDEPGRSGVAETDGATQGSDSIGECLGRSRGGFITKIHLAADGRCQPLALVLTPGHYGDGPQLERVLEQVSAPRIGVGRPRTRPDHVLSDKAYTPRKNRRYLRRRGIRHTIPERLDQQRHPKNRGSRGGRPTGFDGEQYKKRNTVECAINRQASAPSPPATRSAPTSTSAPSHSQPSSSGSEHDPRNSA